MPFLVQKKGKSILLIYNTQSFLSVASLSVFQKKAMFGLLRQYELYHSMDALRPKNRAIFAKQKPANAYLSN
tara:strand:+ start:14183 stop:14398 length:216 start_codon:yes stop_codon:yes gene_type:complete